MLGGFNEGSGEHLCLGIFQGLLLIAAVNAAATIGVVNDIDFNFDSSNVSNLERLLLMLCLVTEVTVNLRWVLTKEHIATV